MRHSRWVPLLAAAAFLFAGDTNAETRTVRIATQYGISYLPMTIMAEKNLLEAEGRSAASISRPTGCASPADRQ